MGVPKRRVSHARQGERRAHHALTTPQLEECPHCHQQKRVSSRLPELWLVQRPRGRPHQAEGQAGRRSLSLLAATASHIGLTVDLDVLRGGDAAVDGPVRVAVDAMGGDHAPEEVVIGAVDWARLNPDTQVILVGDEARVTPLIGGSNGAGSRPTCRSSTPPSPSPWTSIRLRPIRSKRDASINVACAS